MNKKEENNRILGDMSLRDAIFRCGELQVEYEDVCRLMTSKTDPERLMRDLKNPESDAYTWYQEGVAEGILRLNIDLETNIGEPKAKDAYKNLSSERRRQAINKKLDELFGI